MLIFTINDQLEENEIIIIFDHRTQTRKPMERVFRDERRRRQDHHRQRRLSVQNNIGTQYNIYNL